MSVAAMETSVASDCKAITSKASDVTIEAWRSNIFATGTLKAKYFTVAKSEANYSTVMASKVIY